MIEIDTQTLRSLANACANANNEIQNAVTQLTNITTHNDWGCKEKDAINNYTTTNKKKILQLQECSASFLNTLNQVTRDFENLEKEISNRMKEVDSNISQTITISNPWTPPNIEQILKKEVDPKKIFENIGGPLSSFFPGGKDSVVDTITKSVSEAVKNAKDTGLAGYITQTGKDAIAVCNFKDIQL